MPLVPLSSVTGTSLNGLNTTDEVITESYPTIPDYLLEELCESVNYLLVNYGYIPEIASLCQEINNFLEPIDSPFCNTVIALLFKVDYLAGFFQELAFWFLRNGFHYLEETCMAIVLALCGVLLPLFIIADVFCDFDPFPELNQKSITLDTAMITELMQSYEVNACPCMQPANI